MQNYPILLIFTICFQKNRIFTYFFDFEVKSGYTDCGGNDAGLLAELDALINGSIFNFFEKQNNQNKQNLMIFHVFSIDK